MRVLRSCLAALALPLLAGCGGGGGGGGSSSPGPTPMTVSATTTHGLTASLTEDRSTVSVGSTVNYTLTLTNSTSAAVTILYVSALPTQPSGTLIVKNAANVSVYSPTPPPPTLDNFSLAPGQSLTQSFSTAAFAAAGTYTATANFSNDQPNVSVGPLPLTVQ
jgi:uncharacterized repeat protein (TIGR01451 family)